MSFDFAGFDFGTVPDWVAALGTSGATIAAVRLLAKERRDRKDAREIYARQVGISYTERGRDVYRWRVEVSTPTTITKCIVRAYGLSPDGSDVVSTPRG